MRILVDRFIYQGLAALHSSAMARAGDTEQTRFVLREQALTSTSAHCRRSEKLAPCGRSCRWGFEGSSRCQSRSTLSSRPSASLAFHPDRRGWLTTFHTYVLPYTSAVASMVPPDPNATPATSEPGLAGSLGSVRMAMIFLETMFHR
jgi:hypothetical protein